MASKNNIVSIVLFSLSAIMFVIFSVCIFFGGQKIGGAIYFIYFAIMFAFVLLDKKYSQQFVTFNRYAVYLSDAFNILALGSIIYYRIHVPYMIAASALMGVCFAVDLFSKNRLERRRVASVVVALLSCLLMCTIFPFFFIENFSVLFAVLIVIEASVITILKIVLAIKKSKSSHAESQDAEKGDLEREILTAIDKEKNVE